MSYIVVHGHEVIDETGVTRKGGEVFELTDTERIYALKGSGYIKDYVPQGVQKNPTSAAVDVPAEEPKKEDGGDDSAKEPEAGSQADAPKEEEPAAPAADAPAGEEKPADAPAGDPAPAAPADVPTGTAAELG